jgi:cytochrome c553
VTIFLASASVAAAAPSSRIGWTTDALNFVRNGDAEKGMAVAQTCDACHGASPENDPSSFPYLSGQLATYLFKQMQDYKNGSRASQIMKGIMANLSDQDIADVAAYYSRQPLPPTAAPLRFENAEILVEHGDGKRILPPCAACHGSSGQGERVDTPALAGQKASYLEQTLLAYQSDARANDLYQRMRLIARQLSREEIQQLARYYAGLGR